MLRVEDINGWADLSPIQQEKARRWIALNPDFLEGDEVLGLSTIGESVFLNHRDQFNYHQTRITP
jgi:hypothetical protein